VGAHARRMLWASSHPPPSGQLTGHQRPHVALGAVPSVAQRARSLSCDTASPTAPRRPKTAIPRTAPIPAHHRRAHTPPPRHHPVKAGPPPAVRAGTCRRPPPAEPVQPDSPLQTTTVPAWPVGIHSTAAWSAHGRGWACAPRRKALRERPKGGRDAPAARASMRRPLLAIQRATPVASSVCVVLDNSPVNGQKRPYAVVVVIVNGLHSHPGRGTHGQKRTLTVRVRPHRPSRTHSLVPTSSRAGRTPGCARAVGRLADKLGQRRPVVRASPAEQTAD